MEWVNHLLSNVAKYGPRHGWLLLLAGGGVVGFDYFEPIPAASLPDPWPTVALIVAMTGAAVLLVCAVEAIHLQIQQARAISTREDENARLGKEYRLEALRNLELLNDDELAALLWLLRNDKKRFAGRIDYTAGAGLANKCIIGKGSLHSDNVWMVIDVVWERRADLMEKHEKVPWRTSAPWE
jgi:hypothetical protein